MIRCLRHLINTRKVSLVGVLFGLLWQVYGHPRSGGRGVSVGQTYREEVL